MPRTLSDYIAMGNEDLGIEFKSWMDMSDRLAQAKTAKHIAALANHGGGYLIFGVDDKTRQPQGISLFPLDMFSQDAIAGIIHHFLNPRVQVLVDFAKHDGVDYPVIAVQPHGARPVVAIADGPHVDKKGPQGITKGTIYIRSPKPESIPISSADDWFPLIDRCVRHRADLLGSIFRQSLERQAKPSLEGEKMLKMAINDTCSDFETQLDALAGRIPEEELEHQEAVVEARHVSAYAAVGYLLLDGDGAPVRLQGLRNLIDAVDRHMHQYAYIGWNSFLPLHNVPERAPQIRTAAVDGEDTEYLEGMRAQNTGILSLSYDYWRLYERGMGISVETYAEDAPRQRNEDGTPYLRVYWTLLRLHSILIHARFLGAEIDPPHQVVIHMDWRGIEGRRLQRDNHRIVTPATLVSDRYQKTIRIPWVDLIDDYFDCLRRLALPIFDLFPSASRTRPEDWLTREVVEHEFSRSEIPGLRLPD